MGFLKHLADPVETVEKLYDARKPRIPVRAISAERDQDRSQHIVYDLEPIRKRMRVLGFVSVWHDDRLWGPQVFQKP
jgi:hypothetical protein